VPELPEVETIRQGLLPRVVGACVIDARLLRRDILVAPGDPHGGFSRQRRRHTPVAITPTDLLTGMTISDVARKGKQLAIIGKGGGAEHALGVQLGMTGHLELFGAPPQDAKHVHATWTLDNGLTLAFEDARRFGSLRVFRSLEALQEHWQALGPDALTITPAKLRAATLNTHRHVKATLLDQSAIAGVGNIYADEALHLARIHPKAPTWKLTAIDSRRLAHAIGRVLRAAVRARGSTVRDYAAADGQPGSYQARHAVYGRGGEPCRTCGHRLSTALVAQRTTVWCPNCQLLRPRRR
jgi:formamidopyrimidine-DNA glycosylase